MVTLTVNRDLIDHCMDQLSRYNFGKRHSANGTHGQQLTGIIGQSVVMGLFDLPPIDGANGFDNGCDLCYEGLKIDIKTMGRTTEPRPSYTNNFIAFQDAFDTDAYIFCSYNKLRFELTICGWTDRANFTKKRRYYPKGTTRTRNDGTTFQTFADLFEIDNIDIVAVDSIIDLQRQLYAYSRSLGL